MTQTVDNTGPFWVEPLAVLLGRHDSGPDGITSDQAALRRERYGPNLLRPSPRRTILRQFLERFKNPLVILLIAAAALAAVTGDRASFAIITLMVIGSVSLDFVQEYRAGQAAERLRQSVAVQVAVVRGGIAQDVPAAELVPGDVVALVAGDLVPADGRVLEARDFFVNQALLTGEPYPVEKHCADLATADAEMSDAVNAVFMGTSVIGGNGRILICRTGAGTALSAISAALVRHPPPTAFEAGTRQFGLLIMRITMLLVLFVLLVNIFYHRPWLETFLFAVALSVGLTPELLPMVVSVTLARGALRMAKKSVIVKRLPAIHNLGSIDVLCTDKTGTLTEARIRLERHIDPLGRNSERVLELAYLNSHFETGLRSPLDTAILAHGDIDASGWHKIDEVPFGFERRRVSVLVDDGRRRLLIVKGAPEDVLRLSTAYEGGDPAEPLPLDKDALSSIHARFEELSRNGFRVLAIASRVVGPEHLHAVVDDESELVFAGFAAFLDPPKADAARALKQLADYHVVVKVLTGDNELVTQYICRQLDLDVTGVLTGAEIDRLDDSALLARVENANLFCRVSPAQKDRIILAFKRRGHTVGYLGDGINDAPSLHSADVGISVDTAVDIAKEAADMILLKHDLAVLGEGVLEGRRTFGNVMKYIMMATSSNFGNMFSMAGGSLFLPFLPMLPTQILLNNFLYDTSEIAIPMDRVDPRYVEQPRHWDMGFIRNFMLVIGPISSLFDFLTFYVLLRVFNADEALFHTGWFIESLATQVLVIFVIRTRFSPFASHPHPLLVTTSLTAVAAAVILPLTPLARYFGFVPPPPVFFLLLIAMTALYLLVVELVKRAFYRRFTA